MIRSAYACLGPFDFIAAHRLRRFAGAVHPRRRVQPAGNTATKGGMRPLRRMLDQTVLHRIEMNVVQMRRQIALAKAGVVADRVLSVSSLPDAAFAPADHDR
jgi:hypothetical protein